MHRRTRNAPAAKWQAKLLELAIFGDDTLIGSCEQGSAMNKRQHPTKARKKMRNFISGTHSAPFSLFDQKQISYESLAATNVCFCLSKQTVSTHKPDTASSDSPIWSSLLKNIEETALACFTVRMRISKKRERSLMRAKIQALFTKVQQLCSRESRLLEVRGRFIDERQMK